MTDVVLVALIGAVPGTLTTILSLVNRLKLDKVSGQIDGRLTELLALTRKSSHAEGVADESSRNKEAK